MSDVRTLVKEAVIKKKKKKTCLENVMIINFPIKIYHCLLTVTGLSFNPKLLRLSCLFKNPSIKML